MIVDGKGNLFENRRKNKEDRRKSSQIPETEKKRK